MDRRNRKHSFKYYFLYSKEYQIRLNCNKYSAIVHNSHLILRCRPSLVSDRNLFCNIDITIGSDRNLYGRGIITFGSDRNQYGRCDLGFGWESKSVQPAIYDNKTRLLLAIYDITLIK